MDDLMIDESESLFYMGEAEWRDLYGDDEEETRSTNERV